MACCNSNENYSCDNNSGNRSGVNYVIILVLYILLAIIIGSAIWY